MQKPGKNTSLCRNLASFHLSCVCLLVCFIRSNSQFLQVMQSRERSVHVLDGPRDFIVFQIPAKETKTDMLKENKRASNVSKT